MPCVLFSYSAILFLFFHQLDLTSTSRPLLVTPNRFTRTIHGAYWNTGNGSPDAVAFSVDRPGILIAGVCVYGGSVVGGQYEYELELLDDVSYVCSLSFLVCTHWLSLLE